MIGLKTQIGGKDTLVHRIDELWRCRFQFVEVVTEHRNWFAKSVRGESLEAHLGTLRLEPTNSPPFAFDKNAMLRRFMGPDNVQKWEEQGTVIVKGAMSWLFEDPEIRVAQLISREIHMYTYDRRMVNGQRSLGWLRSAYFSQIQQIAHQDPRYYALVAVTSGNLW